MVSFDIANTQFEDFHSSLLRFCSDFADAVVASADPVLLTGATGNMRSFNFDAHAESEALPDEDLIGIANYSCKEAGKIFEIDVMFGVATNGDSNLFRLNAIINRLFPLLYAEKKIPVYNSRDGSPNGFMVAVDGTSVMPVAGFTTRPVKFIQVSFLTDRNVVKPSP